MKPLVKLVVGLAAAYLVIMLVSGLAIQMMVSGSADTIREQLESRVPIPVSFGDGDFDLAQWFLFQPAITLHDVSIGNPDGFSKSNLLDASEVSTQVALLSLFGDRIEIRSVTLGHPVLHVERNRQGKTNLEVAAALIANSATQGAAPASEGAEGSEGKALAIEGFYLDQGEVRYADAAKDSGNPTLFVGDIDLRLLDFSTDATCKLTLQASFYGGSRSEVRFSGRGGPFKPQSLPAQGELAIEIAPSEIPADLREEYLGELLRDPPGGSLVAFETTMQGDLMKTFQGDGKLTLSDFEIGDEHRLPLNGETPLKLTVKRMMTNPSFDLVIPDGSLTLGDGTWNGQAKVSYANSKVQGSSSGKIADADIDQMMSALASASDKVSGTVAVPQYNVRFAGADADQIRNSLAGSGNLTLEEGQISAFNLLGTIQKKADKLLGGDSPEPGETEFTTLSSDFEIRSQQVHLTNILLDSPASDVSGQGYFTFEKELYFDLQATVQGALAATLGGKPNSEGTTVASVPVKIRGTVDSPKVSPDIGRIVEDKVKGVLDSLFKKRQQPSEEAPRP